MSVKVEAITHVKVVITGEDELLELRQILRYYDGLPGGGVDPEKQSIRKELMGACDRALQALDSGTRILEDKEATDATKG